MNPTAASDDLYRAYRLEAEGSRMTRASRWGSLVVAVLNTLFIPVDLALFPDEFASLLVCRVLCNFAMVLVYLRGSARFPVASAIGGLLAIGGVILVAIYQSGGLGGGYVPGLMLVFLGMPVLLPFRARQAAIITGALFLGLAFIPVLSGQQLLTRAQLLHLLFPLAAALESVAACALLDQMRFSDFLQRREIELARDELRALDREKSRFTANIHHELRTPLTLTLAPLEAMLGGEFGEVSELQREYLRSMHSNAQRLLKLINNLLDLAKIEGQQLAIARVPTRFGELVADLASGARPLAERKGVELRASGFEDLPVVNVDRDAIEKVLVNLVGNALKFTDEGGWIDIRGSVEHGEGIRVSVSDSGMGIPEDQLERIFDRFAQVDSSGTRKHEGTGIGLALVKELVELHSGTIWAESEGAGRGSAINMVLPIGDKDEQLGEAVLQTSDGRAVALDESFSAMEPELDLSDERPHSRLVELERTVERAVDEGTRTEGTRLARNVGPDAPEVLVVEDNVDMRRLLHHLIGREFRVRLATNGRDGLEQIRERAPDLVLTDVMMPEMTGTELCAAIKGDPGLERIPVVIVTSKAEREMKIQGLELGAEDYVTKPFHPRELLARVRGVVRVHRLQEALERQNAKLESTNVDLERALSELRDAQVQLVQAERLAAVGELAAGVAHEVNNPVNFATNALKTLRTYVSDIQRFAAQVAELSPGDSARLEAQLAGLSKLRDELDFEETAGSLGELVGIVTEGLERTHRLVGDLRDFAAPGDGPRGEVDLRRGVESTIQLLQFELRKANVAVEFEAPDGLPALEGDVRALNQVFLNLLKNAAEAFDARGGTIWVRLRHEGGVIVVEIRDDGPGIAPEVRARLFEPFFTTKDAGRGSGLGLSISQRIVTEHGGTISVESTPGEGTCFRIELPLRSGGHAA